MNIFLTLTIWILLGVSTAYAGRQRGRDPIVWFVLGLLLGMIALILVFILPSIENASEIQVREKGLDFKQESQLPVGYMYKQWFYLTDEQEQKGPFTFDELKEKKISGVINNYSLVWCEEMKEWSTLQELKILTDIQST